MLVRFDRELQTRVMTDASTVGVAAVLEQRHGDDWRPVAFWSQEAKGCRDSVLCTTDLEWLAVVESVSRVCRDISWRIYLFVCDRITVRWSANFKRVRMSRPFRLDRRRWIERLLPYSFSFEYIPGKDNHVADALSRFS